MCQEQTCLSKPCHLSICTAIKHESPTLCLSLNPHITLADSPLLWHHLTSSPCARGGNYSCASLHSCQTGEAAAATSSRGLLPGLYFSISHHIMPVTLMVRYASWTTLPVGTGGRSSTLNSPASAELQPLSTSLLLVSANGLEATAACTPFWKELVQEPYLT